MRKGLPRLYISGLRLTPKLTDATPGALLVLSAVLFGVMATAVKHATQSLGGAEVAFLRSTFGLAACGIVHLFLRRLVARNQLGLFLRGASGAIAVYAYFLAIQHLPVGIATLLNYMAPIFSAIWSVILFRERLARRAYFALALTTLGLVAVLHGQAPAGSIGIGRWELVGIFGAAWSGLSMVFIAELRKTDGAWEIFAAFSTACVIVTAPGAYANWRWPSLVTWPALVVMGISSVSAQVVMTFAMRHVSATISGIVNQLTPVVALSLGWVLYDERFGGLTRIGIALVLLGGSTGAALARRRSTTT